MVSQHIKEPEEEKHSQIDDPVEACVTGQCQGKGQYHRSFDVPFPEPEIQQVRANGIPCDKNNIFIVIKTFGKKSRGKDHHQHPGQPILTAAETPGKQSVNADYPKIIVQKCIEMPQTVKFSRLHCEMNCGFDEHKRKVKSSPVIAVPIFMQFRQIAKPGLIFPTDGNVQFVHNIFIIHQRSLPFHPFIRTTAIIIIEKQPENRIYDQKSCHHVQVKRLF